MCVERLEYEVHKGHIRNNEVKETKVKMESRIEELEVELVWKDETIKVIDLMNFFNKTANTNIFLINSSLYYY